MTGYMAQGMGAPLHYTLSELSLKHTPADGVFMREQCPHTTFSLSTSSPFLIPPRSVAHHHHLG